MADDIVGARFERTTLSAPVFERVEITGAQFRNVEFKDADMRGVDLVGVRLRGGMLDDVDISGEVGRVTINGIEVGPLIRAELERRHPDLVKMKPADAAGFREAWATLGRLWAGTVERASRLDPALLHESVDGEWSFIETLRHLSFATESWVLRAIQGDPAPWDALSLPWDEMEDTPGVPRDRSARPSLAQALALRSDRFERVRAYLSTLTDDELNGMTTPVAGPGWPPAKSFPVRKCLEIVCNEEWWHRTFAERDLAVLEAASK
ncbi:DinB family protein [Actinoplanes sp. CA-030573]|uniref:DinB family protein n=1 Tax=Actinoplanes sp. CA-030573 TaxID=3239898 RepID=UPI003D8D8966